MINDVIVVLNERFSEFIMYCLMISLMVKIIFVLASMDLSGENSRDSVEIGDIQLLTNMQPMNTLIHSEMTITDPRVLYNGDFSMESEYVYGMQNFDKRCINTMVMMYI